MKNNKQGFTLIELLVVIAIIGLLSTLSVVALNSARARSRDARRVADIKQIQTALEMYYNAHYTYPSTPTGNILLTIASGTTDVYMKIVPTAPTPHDNPSGSSACTTGAAGTNTYKYTLVSPSAYTLSYCLGGDTGGIAAGVHTATPAGIQ